MTMIKWVVFSLVLVAFPFLLTAQIIINEIHADPAPGLAGDANGDGVRSADDDEFVELVNSSGSAIDISGWTLSDAIGVKHTFPSATVIAGNCAIVVFGGGSPTGMFGGAVVQTTGTLGLNNTGDTVTLNNGGSVVATYTYGSEANSDQSITRDPDITGATLVQHSTATGSGGALFSPGTQIDGVAFSGCSGGAGNGKIIISKVTNPGGGTGFSFDGDLGQFNLDDGQSQGFDNLTAGDYDITESPAAGWVLNSVDVTGGSSTAIATGVTIHLQAGDEVSVTFNNDQIIPVIINELDSDSPGTDDHEFIELFDGGTGSTGLDGMVLVLFNGRTDKSYSAYDLDGFSTGTTGFFVIGNSAVTNVDLTISNNSIQNGADAAALYFGDSADFPNGTAISTGKLIDALVYDTSDPDDPGLLVLLNSGQPQVNEAGAGDKDMHSLQRIPNGSGGKRKTATYIAIPPTPGVRNVEPPKEPDISVAQTEIDFGDVQVSDEYDIDLLIRNKGDANLVVDSTKIVGPNAGDWLITTGAAPFTIYLRGDQKMRVCFKPKSDGYKSATLHIRSNDPDEDPLIIELTGRGLAPIISANTQRLHFGLVDIGRGKPMSFDLLNYGSADLNITGFAMRGSNGPQFSLLNADSTFTLLPGESKTHIVLFTPDTSTILKGHVSFFSNDPLNPEFSVPLTGEGRVNRDTTAADSSFAGLIIINEIHYNPPTTQGNDRKFEFLELFNAADTTIDLGGFAFVEGFNHVFQPGDTIAAGSFLLLAIDSTSYPQSRQWDSGNLVNSGELIKLVDSGGFLVDSVAYKTKAPWPTAANGKGPSLELIHPVLDNSLAGSWQASSDARGTPGAPNSVGNPAPVIVLIPPSYDFGVVNAGQKQSGQFQILNRGLETLQISGITLSGHDQADFKLDPVTLPAELAQGEYITVGVSTQPVPTAEKMVNLTITSNDPVNSAIYAQVQMYVNAPPAVPELLQPGWGESADMLVWRQADDPDPGQTCTFRLELSRDEVFQIGRQSLDALADTTVSIRELIPALELSNGEFYYWRVRSVDNYEAQSEYSAAGYFQYQEFVTSVGNSNEQVPLQIALAQNYPNPFNPETGIRFELPKKTRVVIKIFNTRGQLIRLMGNRVYDTGVHHLVWNGRNEFGKQVASGIYLAVMQAKDLANNSFIQARKMTLLR